MGHRPIILLLSVLFAVASSNVLALGLGKIKLESSLNQTLQAEIELFEVRDLVQEEIRVSVASREDFERIGVDKVYFLSDLVFDIKLTGPGSPKIVVSSTKLVREPFLNFVVEVKWPSGKLLREYTLLLDVPAFSEQRAPTVQPTVSRAEPRSSASTSADSGYNPRSSFDGGRTSSPASQTAAPSSAPLSPRYTGDTYEVEANDTLWEIAESVRPDRQVSIHQTMIAIQRVNSDAFINSNINLLKEGRVLRIPDRDQMTDLDRSQAVREVAEQNSQWRGGSDTSSGAELSSSSDYDDGGSSASSPEGRLKLASPDDAYGSSEGRASGGDAEVSTEALENELSSTLEQLDKTNRENSDLRSKVDSLEDQITTMERMLEVTNESLRAQELAAIKVAEERDAAAQAGEDLADSEERGADAIGSLDSELDLNSSYSDSDSSLDASDTPLEVGAEVEATPEPTVEVTPEPTVAATPVPDARRVVKSAPVKEKGFIDIILDNILYIVGGVVLLVGAAAFIIIRRSSADDDDEFEGFMDEAETDDFVEPLVAAPDTREEELDLGDFSADTNEQSVEMENELDLDLDIEPEEETESEAQTEDVVAEADIYIAYGKFDQAEEMLKRALEKEPNDENVRLKLLEVYSSQGDGDNFDEHYTKLRSIASPTVLERADSLRQNIPNIGEFDEGQDSGLSGGVSVDTADSLDLDFDMDLPDDSASDSLSSDDSDFDLGGFDSTDDFGDLGLDNDGGFDSSPVSSLDEDIDSLDTEIDLSVSFDKPTSDADSLAESDDLGDFDLPGDGFDLNDDLDIGLPAEDAKVDTTVNQALNDEYVEQKLSSDMDDDFDLGDSLSLESSGGAGLLDDGGDLDLSALDEELDALTAGLDENDSAGGLGDVGLDFDDLDDDLDTMSSSGASSAADHGSASAADDFELPDIDENDSNDDDLDFLSDSDETATKLDLARAYIDMGDQEGARDIVKEVLSEGNAQQKSEAEALLARLDA